MLLFACGADGDAVEFEGCGRAPWPKSTSIIPEKGEVRPACPKHYDAKYGAVERMQLIAQ